MRKSDKLKGVYYDPSRYLSLPRRILIEMVDIFTVLLLTVVISIAVGMLFLPFPENLAEEQEFDKAVLRVLLMTLVSVSFLYFVVLKNTRFRTLGYQLCGADIVTLEGKSPSILIHAYRFLFVVFGPINLILDIFWIGGDSHRQALRDKFAKTYVIRRNSEPVGSGPIVFAPYSFMGASFIFCEVARDKSGAR